MVDFKEYYKFPLKMWEDFEIKAFTDDDKMAFDWLIPIPMNIKQVFLDIINGECEPNFNVKKEFYHKNDGIVWCKFLEGDKEGMEYKMFRIRGWGMLTGTGGYNLDPDVAADVQDNFMNYCINRLNKRLD
jgi:hypothetical protein